jgi:glutamyl-tRNA reductase
MKPLPDESFEDWSKRVSMFEKGKAMQDIAQGKDVEVVLEDMSRRILDKLMNPIYKALRDSLKSEFDAKKSREEYEKNMKNKRPSSDHVDTDT